MFHNDIYEYSKKLEKNKLNEASGVGHVGTYRIPVNLAPQIWQKDSLAPFDTPVSDYMSADLAYDSYDGQMERTPQQIKKEEQWAQKPVLEHLLKEDLAVWFGTKKKPKGSKQPKGPWVNICRKKEGGGHPPCGRSEADTKGYPKCRAAGVASKMTDAQKKAACAQKRREEKKEPKGGKGNKPTMVSYKPKKQNESTKEIILKVLREHLKK